MSNECEPNGGGKASSCIFVVASVLILLIAMLTPAFISMFVVWLIKSATVDICRKLQLTAHAIVLVRIFEFGAITVFLCLVECAILRRTPLGTYVKNMLTHLKNK
jgi:hypothetical protein